MTQKIAEAGWKDACSYASPRQERQSGRVVVAAAIATEKGTFQPFPSWPGLSNYCAVSKMLAVDDPARDRRGIPRVVVDSLPCCDHLDTLGKYLDHYPRQMSV